MNEDQQLKINPILSVAFLLQALFIIFAVISFNNILKPDNPIAEIKVDDYSSADQEKFSIDGQEYGLSADDKTVLGYTIYKIAAQNNSGNLAARGAKIRQDSVHTLYRDDTKAYYMYFIVDIEKLGQSYRVFFRQKNQSTMTDAERNEPHFIAFCPKESDLIYGEFDCHDDYRGDAEGIMAREVLVGKELDHASIVVEGDPSKNEKLFISLQTEDESQDAHDAAIAETTEYLNGIGINFEDYDYQVGPFLRHD